MFVEIYDGENYAYKRSWLFNLYARTASDTGFPLADPSADRVYYRRADCPVFLYLKCYLALAPRGLLCTPMCVVRRASVVS